jgi:hypothetical protein
MSNRVIAAITLMFHTVRKENTLNGLRSEFGSLTRWKDITNTPKTMKMAIEAWGVKKMLIGSATLKSSRRLAIDEKNHRRNNFSPKMGNKLIGEEESKCSLKNVAMLALSNTILSMSTKTRELGKGTLLSKIGTMSSRDVFTSRVSTKNSNRRVELCADYSGKLLINRKKLTTRRHQINPGKSRIVINK